VARHFAFKGGSRRDTIIRDTLFTIAFIPPPPPGPYQLVVQYHRQGDVGSRTDVSQLILFESAPVEVLIEE
jgi:hypothetical protein